MTLFEIWILRFEIYLPNFKIRWCLKFVISGLSGLGLCMMKKTVILSSILILLMLVVTGPSWSTDNPVWWPSAIAEAQKDGYALTTPDEIQALYASSDNYLIVDVRPDYEFKAGHLPGAKNFEIDLGDRLELKPQKAEAFKKVLGMDKSRGIVIYCRSFR